MTSPGSAPDALPADWLERVVQVKTITATLLTISGYLVVLMVTGSFLRSKAGETIWRGAMILLAAMAIMWAYHLARLLWWKRMPERWPPVSGWGVVNDRQAYFTLALFGLVAITLTAWQYYTDPEHWTITLILWALLFVFIAAVCVPGVVIRPAAPRIARKYIDRPLSQAD